MEDVLDVDVDVSDVLLDCIGFVLVSITVGLDEVSLSHQLFPDGSLGPNNFSVKSEKYPPPR
jgi:hypothetical protein